jgi:hypothetical protein
LSTGATPGRGQQQTPPGLCGYSLFNQVADAGWSKAPGQGQPHYL